MKQIAPHIYVEDGYRGVTVGCIVTPSGPVCIDSPMLPADARNWRAKIAKLSDKPVRFVVLTDGARERILGVQYLSGVVVAHDVTWDKIKGLGEVFRTQAADLVAPCGAEAAAEVAADLQLVLPQITFTETLIIHQDDMPIVLRYVGGVTPGNIWVHLPKQHVVFAGDLVTRSTHPLLAEADLALWLNRLEQLKSKEFPAKTIVPGRGSPCKKAALQPLMDYLVEMRARVQALVRSRRPRADTTQLAAEFLNRYPESEQDQECIQRRIKAGLDHLYDSLKSKKTRSNVQ
jgi:glyoxylase-like metal-dependent hydrolase (beta-lactamase superfamily II)